MAEGQGAKVSLGEELTVKVEQEAKRRFLPISAFVRMAVADYLERLAKAEGQGGK